ncbi:MAG: CTP synthetase [Pseudomonadota bacterium]|nr:CTP synthetase [Pseudomonadota bacterium]
MLRLASMLFSLIGTTLAGSGIVVALVLGHDTLRPILVAAAIGGILAVPVTYAVTKRLMA